MLSCMLFFFLEDHRSKFSQTEKQSISPVWYHYFNWSKRSEHTVLLCSEELSLSRGVVNYLRVFFYSLCTCNSHRWRYIFEFFFSAILAEADCPDWIDNLFCQVKKGSRYSSRTLSFLLILSFRWLLLRHVTKLSVGECSLFQFLQAPPETPRFVGS